MGRKTVQLVLCAALFGCHEKPKTVEVVIKEQPTIEIEIEIEATIEQKVDEDLVLASFSTKYATRGKHKARASNIIQAAENLNGVILFPGEEFSFNGVVGIRSKSSGFRKAGVYHKGLSVLGMGGGICQVSSTLYAAAMLGRLEITKRFSHSRPSDYIPVGMDATVSWPEMDLRFKNNKEVPLKIQAETLNGKLTVSIIGATCDYEVKRYFRVFRTIPFEKEYEYSENVEKPFRKQKGKDGKPGVMTWKYLRGGMVFEKTKVKSLYMPVNEFWVTNEVDKETEDDYGVENLSQ